MPSVPSTRNSASYAVYNSDRQILPFYVVYVHLHQMMILKGSVSYTYVLCHLLYKFVIY